MSNILYALLALIIFSELSATQSTRQEVVDSEKVKQSVFLIKQRRELLVDGYYKRCFDNLLLKEIVILLINFVYGDPLQYRNQDKLPEDLSGEDLRGYDFTGSRFTGTNLTDSNLQNVILTNTSCNYLKTYLKNKRACRLVDVYSYLEGLCEDIRSIENIYPTLKKNEEKADLLLIACGLSRFPLYEGVDFYTKVYYWSCAWLHWKKRSGKLYSDMKQSCWVESEFYYVFWPTKYPPSKMSIHFDISHLNFHESLMSIKAPHTDFNEYLSDFNEGFNTYVKDILSSYIHPIQKKIKGLKMVYDTTSSKEFKEEACNIAYGLSQSYKVEKGLIDYYHFFHKNRIVELKSLMKKRGHRLDWESWSY